MVRYPHQGMDHDPYHHDQNSRHMDHTPQDHYTPVHNQGDTEDEQHGDVAHDQPYHQHQHHQEQHSVEDDDGDDRRGEEDGAVTQSESDEAHCRDPSDGGITEEESNASPPPPPPPPLPRTQEQPTSFSRRKPRNQAKQRRSTFSWFNYHPVVYHASEYCKKHNSVPSVIAYARILGAGKGTVDYYVRARSITIGRWGHGSDCQIKSDTRSISRKHAKLYWDSALDNWMLTCLSAKNGMIVDGAPIAPFGVPVPLKSRTLVEIGDVAFYFLTATENTFSVNDLQLLEEAIAEARVAEENDLRYAAVNGTPEEEEEDEVRPEVRPSSRGERSSSKKKPADQKTSKDGARKGFKQPATTVEHGVTSDSEASDDDQLPVPDILDDPKYRLALPSGSKRRGGEKGSGSKKRRKRDRTYDVSNYESLNYTEEWNKKEKTDFTRALFAVGIDANYNDDGVLEFDWYRFRCAADFPKKSDEMLEDHYRRLMSDVHELLDGDERDKKAKTSRPKNGDGSDRNTTATNQKSGKRKRGEEDGSENGSDENRDRLIGLVTAQKLRVRIGILEAAQRVDSKLWDFAMIKLESTLQSSLKEFPDWWQRGVHDRDLMRGVALHGIGRWSFIWEDPALKSFVSESRSHDFHNEQMVWPSDQAAMKRVREVGSAMMFEMKRLAKRDAEEERRQRKRVRKKEKLLARKHAGNQRHGSSNKYGGGGGDNGQYDDERDGMDEEEEEEIEEEVEYGNNYQEDEQPQQDSGDFYDVDPTEERHDNGESTADDSASENKNEPTPAEEVETEDEEEEGEDDGNRDGNMHDESAYQEDDEMEMHHNNNNAHQDHQQQQHGQRNVYDNHSNSNAANQRHHFNDDDRYEEPMRYAHDTPNSRYYDDREYSTASDSR